MTGAEILAAFDECECGDYRLDHKGGTGRCRMRDDLSHGFQPCKAFTLSRKSCAKATVIPEAWRGPDVELRIQKASGGL